jgi:hypothetical protein
LRCSAKPDNRQHVRQDVAQVAGDEDGQGLLQQHHQQDEC